MLRQSRQSLQIIESAYESSAEDGMRVMSVQVRDGQKIMLDKLAKYNGVPTAVILRSIIDFYAEHELKENGMLQ